MRHVLAVYVTHRIFNLTWAMVVAQLLEWSQPAEYPGSNTEINRF